MNDLESLFDARRSLKDRLAQLGDTLSTMSDITTETALANNIINSLEELRQINHQIKEIQDRNH